MTPLGHFQQAVNAADNAAWVSAWAGRVAASATLAGNAQVATGATTIALAASLFEQMVRPNAKKAANDSFVDGATGLMSQRVPALAPAFTELGEWVKGNNYLNHPLVK